MLYHFRGDITMNHFSTVEVLVRVCLHFNTPTEEWDLFFLRNSDSVFCCRLWPCGLTPCSSIDVSFLSNHLPGRTMAQAVSRRLPTTAARVRAQVRSCGISGEQSGTGADFLPLLRIPLLIFIPPTAPHSSSIIRGWYSRPVSGLLYQVDSVSPHPNKLKNKNESPASIILKAPWTNLLLPDHKVNLKSQLCSMLRIVLISVTRKHKLL
jgi:hypothetical protein